MQIYVTELEIYTRMKAGHMLHGGDMESHPKSSKSSMIEINGVE